MCKATPVHSPNYTRARAKEEGRSSEQIKPQVTNAS